VTVQVTLCVAVDVEPPNQAASFHRLFPHRRVDSPTAPRNLAGSPYVDRQ
jgi:hypothetical protein